jgi:hypothetical protein
MIMGRMPCIVRMRMRDTEEYKEWTGEVHENIYEATTPREKKMTCYKVNQ